MIKNPIRIAWCILGLICLSLGTIGIVLPLLPTVPFYMATVFCFAKSSPRLHSWFVSTGLYKKHLESYVLQRAMSLKTKIRISGTVTAVMAISFFCMKNIPIGQICLGAVWIWHLYYFFIRIKTIGQEEIIMEKPYEEAEISENI